MRFESRAYVPISDVMKWLNHELYIEPIDCYIDPVRPVSRAIITHGHADHARAGHLMCWPHNKLLISCKHATGQNALATFSLCFGEH